MARHQRIFESGRRPTQASRESRDLPSATLHNLDRIAVFQEPACGLLAEQFVSELQ